MKELERKKEEHKEHNDNEHYHISIDPWSLDTTGKLGKLGEINYNKLIKDFGISKIDITTLPNIFKQELLFRRGIIFAHRDFDKILKAIENKERFIMMTGLMPTGKFHIGHLVLASQFLFYQKLGAKLYIAVADIEAYNMRNQSLKISKDIAIKEYIANYIALGIKPKDCHIYFQSDRIKKSKKSNISKANAYYRLQNILARHITLNEFRAVYGTITPARIISALLQASDMLHPQLKEFDNGLNIVVPVGPDQDPHIRLARDVVKRIKEIKLKPICSTYHKLVPGLKGGKMSASRPNSFIALTDSEEEITTKIKKYAFSGGQPTIKEHREKGGNPDIDVSFQYLKFFFEPDDKKLMEIYHAYKSGAMLTGELKEITIKKITRFIREHKKRRERILKDPKIIEKYID